MKNKLSKYGIYGIVILFILFIIALFSPKIIAKTNTPQYCASCHVMEEQYITLMKGGLHNSLKCVDCHLPNDSKINFYIWKGIDGTKDLIHFYSGNVPEKIRISGHGKKTVQVNCIRCHGEMVSRISVSERYCWDCHRRTTHKLRAFSETI